MEGFKYLGTTFTNENSVQEEFECILKLRNALLLFGAYSFVFPFPIQNTEDQDI